MKETNLTIEQIESLLVNTPDSAFYIRRNIVVPNVDWGFLNHEADLLVLSNAGYLTEIEIKRTWSDFKADFEKWHDHYDKKLSHFYYAVPESIGEKVFNWLYEGSFGSRLYSGSLRYSNSHVLHPTPNNPHECGLILYADPDAYHNRGSFGINVPAKRMGNYKVSKDEELKLLRLLGMRVWNLKSKVAKLQEKSLFG